MEELEVEETPYSVPVATNQIIPGSSLGTPGFNAAIEAHIFAEFLKVANPTPNRLTILSWIAVKLFRGIWNFRNIKRRTFNGSLVSVRS